VKTKTMSDKSDVPYSCQPLQLNPAYDSTDVTDINGKNNQQQNINIQTGVMLAEQTSSQDPICTIDNITTTYVSDSTDRLSQVQVENREYLEGSLSDMSDRLDDNDDDDNNKN